MNTVRRRPGIDTGESEKVKIFSKILLRVNQKFLALFLKLYKIADIESFIA